MKKGIIVLSILLYPLVIPLVMACDCDKSYPVLGVAPSASPNMVIEPSYAHLTKKKAKLAKKKVKKVKIVKKNVQTLQCPPPEKLQYEPVTSEMPLLMEKKAPRKQEKGAEYEEGTDTYVTPHSYEVVKDKPIIDPPIQTNLSK